MNVDLKGAGQSILGRLRNSWPPLVTLVVFLGAWQVVHVMEVGRIPLPSPLRLARTAAQMAASTEFWGAAWESGKIFLAGITPAILLGIPIGVVIGNVRKLDIALSPIIFGLFATPTVALIPLFLLIFGFRFFANAVIVFVFVFVWVVLQTTAGVKACEASHVEVARSLRTPKWRVWFEITLPAAMPYIVAGIRLGIRSALVGVIIAEFETFLRGLGGIILREAQSYRLAEATVPALLFAIVGIALTGGLFRIEARLQKWKASQSR